MSAECRHGYRPSSKNGHNFAGGDERKIERHEKRCRKAKFVAHRGLLFWAVCCISCQRRVV